MQIAVTRALAIRRQLDIGLREVITDEQQRFRKRYGEHVGEALANAPI